MTWCDARIAQTGDSDSSVWGRASESLWPTHQVMGSQMHTWSCVAIKVGPLSRTKASDQYVRAPSGYGQPLRSRHCRGTSHVEGPELVHRLPFWRPSQWALFLAVKWSPSLECQRARSCS